MSSLVYKCEYCGNEFISRKGCRSRIPKFCSSECYGKSKIGKSPWNKGVEMWAGKEHPRGMLGKTSARKGTHPSEGTIKKLSDSHRGLKYPTFSGENHWNWKGGTSKERERIKQSSEYKEWRRLVFERDQYTCQHCGARGKTLNAHHVLPFSENKSERFSVSNGITLCVECHKKTESYGRKNCKNETLSQESA